MIKGIDAILIGSEDSQVLADFYKDKVGLEMANEMEMGEDGTKGFELKAGNFTLYLTDHSEVKGKASDPERMMINFEVDDAEAEVEKLTKAGVKVIKELYHVEGYGLIATFEDPDGNYFQLVQVREN